MSFSHHSQVINYLIEKFSFQSYLEIGINNPKDNFDLIKCKLKIGVDPEPKAMASFVGTSDEFFNLNSRGFDIIFIDGLHHADQVKKDIENSLKVLNTNGIILLHDTNPQSERYTHVPRDLPTGKRWNGDVYKVLTCLGDFEYRTLNFDSNGLTVLKTMGKVSELKELSYSSFDSNRQYLTRLCTTEQFKEWI